MAVFTALEDGQLAQLADLYGLAPALRAEGIPQGIENTNYLLFEPGRDAPGWVLTLLEKPTELAYVQAVLGAADAAGLPVPLPLRSRSGQRHVQLGGRTAVLTPRLPGHHPAAAPDADQCGAIGGFLGRLHGSVAPAVPPRADPQGLDWVLAEADALLADDGEARACRDLLAGEAAALRQLPCCTCHGDLFRDNALFDAGRLTGVIDWYNAARAPAGFDLAIVLNDWCTDTDGNLEAKRTVSLLGAYVEAAAPDPATLERMPLLRAWAALRFWTSRMLASGAGGGSPDPQARPLYRGKPPGEQRKKMIAALAGAERDRWRCLANLPG